MPVHAPPTLLADLGASIPVVAAPMAGGPGTPELALAAARAGALGFAAAGYLSPDGLVALIAAVRAGTTTFGVNLFVPNSPTVDRDAYRRFRERLLPIAERLGVELPERPVEDDDAFGDKVDLLLADPVPLVSFTFGLPPARVVDALRRVGTTLVQTVTSRAEAELAAAAGMDALAVQSTEAGGHSATFTPSTTRSAGTVPTRIVDLVREVATTTTLPLVAAGGIATPADVAEVLAAGASAVMVGTALLRSDESGAGDAYRAAVADATRATVVTRAFTGRPARGIGNGFIDAFEADAPLGYPAVNHLTSPIRRAARAAGDADLFNLWAGTGHGLAASGPAEQILRDLAGDL